jgi:hypothetical protein
MDVSSSEPKEGFVLDWGKLSREGGREEPFLFPVGDKWLAHNHTVTRWSVSWKRVLFSQEKQHRTESHCSWQLVSFSQFWRLESRLRHQQGQVLVRAPLLGCKWQKESGSLRPLLPRQEPYLLII